MRALGMGVAMLSGAKSRRIGRREPKSRENLDLPLTLSEPLTQAIIKTSFFRGIKPAEKKSNRQTMVVNPNIGQRIIPASEKDSPCGGSIKKALFIRRYIR